MYLELMIVMLLVKIRRDIGRQLLNDDGIPGGHVGDVVVMVGGGVGIGFARRRSVRGGGGGRGATTLSDKKLQECLSLCSQAAEEIFAFYRDCIKQKMSIDSPNVAKSNLVTVTGKEAEATA